VSTATRDELRRRLAPGADTHAPLSHYEVADHETEAAVLVPLYLEGGEPHAVFIKRRDDMRRHPGEVAFPGGRRDHDDRDLEATALREAEEEIGLAPADVELVGTLAPVRTFVTGYVIFPHIGLIEPGHEWVTSEDEVALVMELPLRALVDGFDQRPITRRGMTFETDTYVVGDHLIWGATARILGDLLGRLAPLLSESA
jgi:8-oxo-dGTP pyrophosphatase MutT (NUDIX family)